MPVLRKYNNQSVMTQPSFDPANYTQCPPEACGYGKRKMVLERTLEKIVMVNESVVETVLMLDSLLRLQVPKVTRHRLQGGKQDCPYYACCLIFRDREPEELLV